MSEPARRDCLTDPEERLRQRCSFLTELRELMERHNAEFEVVVTPISDGQWTTEIEVYVDRYSNLCGSQKDRIDIAGVARMIHAAEQNGSDVR